jgi:2-polyprenyl-3-methyl-5-hydroxy-6-metoxy-1,4-benzoquinol methylase
MSAQKFYDLLAVEVRDNTLGLPAQEYHELRRYYHALSDNPENEAFYCYNWVRRTTPMVRLIMSLPKRNIPWRVLDAGCGVGTESIFWCTLRDDIEVVGVDVRVSRLNVAEARRIRYEQRLGKSVNVRFLEQNIFRTLKEEHFDLVWTMEAISHIDPAEEFLIAVSENLSERGYLIISDSNILNPAMAWRILNMRCRGMAAHVHKSTSSGEIIPYAQERLLTVGWLSKMLRQAGFSLVQSQLSIFFPPILGRVHTLFSICTWVDAVCDRIPLVRNLGGIYTTVASK